MKTAYIMFNVRDAQWIAYDSQWYEIGAEATEYDDCERLALDRGYNNIQYVPNKPTLIAKV